MILRPLQYSEIDLIWQQISRRELITQNYVKQSLQLEDCFYDVQQWDDDHLQHDPPKLKQLYLQQAEMIGAFNPKGTLLGVSVVSNQLIQDYPEAKLLQYFYVDADHQGQGIGALLMQSATHSAHKLGAKHLYISATPSKKTVDFYMKHGAKLLDHPDPQLWQLEPEDIHLLCEV
ncbi:GNAT family N-acetyltransferase [Acinetobacter sp. NIPH 1958]|uniref:GNAT family N-acetyltransferase n=1 Tax=unclassified Acinetobacter TaxID=196816 RepID=UPI000518B6FC|nr:GNAT family N-acetyltransferase [Acinetobacter sp. ANC 3929]MCH7353741.1 GNAT family N-acetyltransferase [Acinetobacter sp. NIPH 2023]MCH7357386.1 GNAT family N-acetyltransferase [Acinetobacter sp. NIPH 1958]MCH7361090.1 GNAT family N-acetyltransferase [Acinetobacter sp. NIPH 2024]